MGNPRRGFPTEKQSTGLFFAPPALFWTKISQPAGCDEGAAPQPRRLLKKAGENFSLSCYRKTVHRQTDPSVFRRVFLSPQVEISNCISARFIV